MSARAKLPSPARDWYWAASEQDRREYDAFGPWVFEVKNEAAMPPRFRPFWSGNRDARFLLKVPVRADRVDMRPGMDLYRLVLAVDEDGIRLLSLVDGAVEQRDIAWRDIAGYRSFSDLLDARWTLLLRSGESIAFGYNAVSEPLLDSVGAFVRGKLKGENKQQARPRTRSHVEISDLFFKNRLVQLQAESPHAVEILHYEPRSRPCRIGRYRFGLSAGLMVVDTGGELVIVDGGGAFRRFFETNYAIRHTYLPTARLSGFAVERPDRDSAFFRLALQLDRQTVEIPSLEPMGRVVASLQALGMGAGAAA